MDYYNFKIDVTGEPEFASFLTSLPREDQVRKKLDRMLDDLKINPDAGDQIKKELWPNHYKKAGFTNLFRYEADDSMRAIYTIKRVGNLHVEVAIIEFFRTHKEYERRFHY